MSNPVRTGPTMNTKIPSQKNRPQSRRAVSKRTPIILHRIRSLICAAIAVMSGMLIPHPANTAENSKTDETRQEVGRTVTLLLRDGNIQQALKSLEAVSDGTTLNSLLGEEGISSAGAGLHRALSQLSSEEQFELLSKWSMPAEAPAKIRVLTVLVPTLAPPMEFARALGERPRDSSFPVPSIGEVRGVFSSAWSLIVAARESGRLKRLTTDLAKLVDQSSERHSVVDHGPDCRPQRRHLQSKRNDFESRQSTQKCDAGEWCGTS
jgi:hypothetical protein